MTPGKKPRTRAQILRDQRLRRALRGGKIAKPIPLSLLRREIASLTRQLRQATVDGAKLGEEIKTLSSGDKKDINIRNIKLARLQQLILDQNALEAKLKNLTALLPKR